LLLDSGLYQKVDALRRNQWSASAGIGGRLAPELVVGFPRIMQLPRSKIYIGLKPSLQKYPIGAQFITSNILLYIMKKALHEKRRASFVNYYNYLTAKGLSGSA
jgi:hypothetical protein